MTVKGARKVRQTAAALAKMAAEKGTRDAALALGVSRQTVERHVAGSEVAPVIVDHRSQYDDKIDEVLLMMCEGRWRVGASVRELARKWNVSVHSAHQVVAEAVRFVRRTAHDQVETKISLLLDTIEAQALQEGDRMAAIKACELHLKMYGKLVDRQEIKHDHYANLSDAQLVEAVRVELKQLEERAPEGTNE